MDKNLYRLLALILLAAFIVPLATPASAKTIQSPESKEYESNNTRVIDIPIIWDDPGYTYPKLFHMTANRVTDFLSSGTSKSFTRQSLNTKGATRLHFAGTLYHSIETGTYNYYIRFGICYYDADAVRHVSIWYRDVLSGEALTPDEYSVVVSDLNLLPSREYYVYIKDLTYPSDPDEAYIYGRIDVYYTTFAV